MTSHFERQGQTIVDNGDDTITITGFASGGSRYYDSYGNFVLKNPGEVRISDVINYNGTPWRPKRRHRGPGHLPNRPGLDWQQRPFRPRLLRGRCAVHELGV